MRAFAPTLLLFLSLTIPTIAYDFDSQKPFNHPSSNNDDRIIEIERYDDEQVWRIDWSGYGEKNKNDIMEMVDLFDLDVWHTTRSNIDIRLNSNQLKILQDIIPPEAFKPFIQDIQSLVDETLFSIQDYDEFDISEDINQIEEEDVDEVEADKGDVISIFKSLKKKKKGKKGKKGGNQRPIPKPEPKPKIDPFNLTTIETPYHDKFHSLKEIYKFGSELIKTFNHSTSINSSSRIIVEEINIGNTYLGEKLKGYTAKINHKRSNSIVRANEDNLQGLELEFIIQAGSHGREWVGPSSALYFLHHLLLRATSEPNSDAAILLKSFRFTIIPQINPDGYAHSRDKSRLWRKNRQDVGGKGNCLGIDLNANWGYKWRSSRSTPCSEGYGGKEAFEAYETKAMSEYLSSAAERGNRVRAFIDLHSYGQLFMFPFAHSCDDFPPDAEMLMEAGLGVAKAMRTKQGQGYEAGQACDLTYRAPGDAIDYTYGVTDVRWSYSAELRDTGTYGFMLPPKLIRPTADEITAGLMYLAKFIYALEVNPP
ncbi:uncharacterized protein L201_007696 [Kwoniella dendrophila CBS 6074]|uniref:Inactive metallocarboxypeptidase ECM14 n=1 Tax=Kwoniella dendrophila CBS 6074 TaxID=1295534 RepID=A0AAX4K5A2_9TREE